MPILKAIAGHGNTRGIRAYLEKNGRALARDFLNLPMEKWIEETGGVPPVSVAWDKEMDNTRVMHKGNDPWRGLKARTFKHFVISPDPKDDIDLASLRGLAQAWAAKYFGNHEVVIIYHDDNEQGIPHAHIVVNNIDLLTKYRLHTDHPEDLNRALQDMARERGLTGLSNEMPKRGEKSRKLDRPRSRQAVYFGRAERELMRKGDYSWVGDIRARVALAKNTSRTEADFFKALKKLGIEVSENSESARRDDWLFIIADEPSKRVSGEKLGLTYGKQMLLDRFDRQAAYHPTARSEREIRSRAVNAVLLNDLNDLSRLSAVLETCAKFDVRYLEDFDSRLATLKRRGNESSEGFRRLVAAKEYAVENKIMERRSDRGEAQPSTTRRRGGSVEQPRSRVQEAERMRTRERGER